MKQRTVVEVFTKHLVLVFSLFTGLEDLGCCVGMQNVVCCADKVPQQAGHKENIFVACFFLFYCCRRIF